MSHQDNRYVGWDIGGAHLKTAVVDDEGRVLQVEQHATPLWQGLECLQSTLNDVRTRLAVADPGHAVTTTGELADLFQNRQQGLDALLNIFCTVFKPEKVRVYAGEAGLIPVSEASRQYRQVASANWHATGTYVASQQHDGILMDIGSTTTDLVPFKASRLCNRGYTDQERMRYDELLYTGIVRTPLMHIRSKVPFEGEWQSIAAEQFATMADVYRITGELDESCDLMSATDGSGKQTGDSVRRIARMLGKDVQDSGPFDKYQELARYFAEEHIHMIDQSLHRVISANDLSAPLKLIGAGAGRFLVAKLALRHNCKYTDIVQMLSVDKNQQARAADCATAVSVAQLMRLTG